MKRPEGKIAVVTGSSRISLRFKRADLLAVVGIIVAGALGPGPACAESEILRVGTWVTKCDAPNLRQQTLVAKKNEFALHDTLYLDSECKKIGLDGVLEVEMILGSEVKGKKGFFEFQSRLKSKVYHVPSDEGATMLNNNKLCGRSDWKKGTTVDASNCSDAGIAKGSTCYSVIWIEGQRLRFGQLSSEQDCSTPRKRPKELETATFVFQPGS